jgi:hypothetical protein
LTWLEDVENDLRELHLKRQTQKENNREEWASLVRESEVLKRAVEPITIRNELCEHRIISTEVENFPLNDSF